MAKEKTTRPVVTPELPQIGSSDPPLEPSRFARKSGKKDRSRTVRLTIDIPLALDFRLDNIAKFQRCQKGAFALRLIDQGLRSYKDDASLKAVWEEISGQAGETARESAA